MSILSRSAHDSLHRASTAPPPPLHPLSGRAIIITGQSHRQNNKPGLKLTVCFIEPGAASGIGRALALHLATLGVRLALTDVNVEGGRAVCAEIRELGECDVVFAGLDVTSTSSDWPVSLCFKAHFWAEKTARCLARMHALMLFLFTSR